MTALYAEDAVLLPTISNQPRLSPVEIEDYFDQFLALKPDGKILQSNTRAFDNIAISSGIYEFSFADGSKVLLVTLTCTS